MTNNSFISQTWAILVPKRNFDQKSVQCPTKSPESQMSKSRIFQFTWFNKETNDKNQIKWDPDMIKSHQGQFWKPQNIRNSMNNNIFLLRLRFDQNVLKKCKFFLSFWLKYCWYPFFWHLNQGKFLGYYSDFWSKFLLGAKIAHVWE